MNEKYYISFVDTENVSYEAIRGIKEIQRMYADYNNAGVHCYGMEDFKSPNSRGWKEKAERLGRVYWHKVEEPREKNTVDKKIKQGIDKILGNPRYDRINVWIIATSDGDFLSAINKIKERDNNIVIGIGSSDPSERLKKACDKYYKQEGPYKFCQIK